MTQIPEALKPGDIIRIVAPAKAIDSKLIEYASEFLEGKGFVVQIGEHCTGRYNYFSGTIPERLSDFQNAIDSPEVKAILCARGGYGCMHIVDRVGWAGQLTNPKWIVGFSDITVLHHRMQKLGIASIHGTMPLDFQKNSDEALNTMIGLLLGKRDPLTWRTMKANKSGSARGNLVGGNLSIIYSLLGTDDQIDYKNCILFIEEVSEPIYHIDRIFHALQKAGVLNSIIGLVVGGMTSISDTEHPFGKGVRETILSHLEYLPIPVCFELPCGHIDDNRALILGAEVELLVKNQDCSISYC